MGRQCEAIAASWLQDVGYRIVKKNYCIRGGEIDLIVTKEDWLVFVEVKHIGNSGIESLEQLINRSKRQRILSTAKKFLSEETFYTNFRIRFDVLGIDADKNSVNHFENAFGENSLL